MINRVRIHIPINTPEQIVVRDEIAKILSRDYKAVIFEFEEIVKVIDGELMSCPFSIVVIYMDSFSDELLSYFKELAVVISKEVGDSVVLEVTRESIYIGTAK
jgi:uncharacterized protein with ATP-grasp and redox domains